MFFNVESFELLTPYTIQFRGYSYSGQLFANTVLNYNGELLSIGGPDISGKRKQWLEEEMRSLFGACGPFKEEEIENKLETISYRFSNYNL